MKTVRTLLAALFFLACSHKMPTKQNGETQLPQWAMFGKNLRHTSNAADPVEYYDGPLLGKISWSSLRTFEGYWCTPSIGTDGTIYIASGSEYIYADSGFIYAVHPNGAIKWQFRTQRPNYGTGALGQDGTYFYGSSDRYLYAIDREGNLKWKRMMGYFNTEARPAIASGGEVIVSVDSGVTALHQETGDILWFYEVPMAGGFSISIDNSGNIYTGTQVSLLALTSTGSKRWEFSCTFGPREIMIGYDGTLYFHLNSDSLFYALSPDGSLKWIFNLQGQAENNSPCIGSDGSVYAINSSIQPQKLYKLSETGKVEWEIELAKLAERGGVFLNDSTPIIDKSGTIYLAMGFTGTDNFYAINQKRQLKWSVTVDNPGVFIFPKPAIAADGTLYIAGDFTLNAIK